MAIEMDPKIEAIFVGNFPYIALNHGPYIWYSYGPLPVTSNPIY